MTVRFFVLTFAASWSCYAAAAAAGSGSSGADLPALPAAWIYLGTFAPSLVALAITATAEGRDGVAALVDRLFRWNVDARWYAFAVGYMATIKLLAAVGQRIVAGAWPRAGDVPWYLLIAAIAISTPVQAGEEIGWRGYAFPRLAARFGFGLASILLGVVWSVWHLPLFFIPGVDVYRQSFWVFLMAVTPLSVAMAWLYVQTGGSLLLTMLMHSAVNQTTLAVSAGGDAAAGQFAFAGSPFAWLTIALLWVGAAACIVHSAAPEPDHRRSRSLS